MNANHQSLIARSVLIILFSWAGLTEVSQSALASQQASIQEDVIGQPTDGGSPYYVGVDTNPGKCAVWLGEMRSIVTGFKWLLRAENIRILVLAAGSNYEFTSNAMGAILLRNVMSHDPMRGENLPPF